jgi:hypothetical protein
MMTINGKFRRLGACSGLLTVPNIYMGVADSRGAFALNIH